MPRNTPLFSPVSSIFGHPSIKPRENLMYCSIYQVRVWGGIGEEERKAMTWPKLLYLLAVQSQLAWSGPVPEAVGGLFFWQPKS